MSRRKATYSAHLAKILNERPDEVRETGGWRERILQGLSFDSVESIKARAALTDAELVLEGTANAMSWLRRSQPALAGQVPLDLLVTQAGADEVETLLRRIDHGAYT